MLRAYHGATCTVSAPLCTLGRPNLDFGPGFYLTTIRQQAVDWAQRSLNATRPQWLNLYDLDLDRIHTAYRCLSFPAYDAEWLQFIALSRRGQQPWAGYDFIEGGVADDRVIDTVNLYLLDLMSADEALKRLALHQPNQQMCLLSQSLVDECLTYISSEPLNPAAKAEKGGTPC